MRKNRIQHMLDRIPGWLWPVLMFGLPAALAYLPLAGRLGLYADDWYLTLSGETQGIQEFWHIFVIDRPLRAFLVGGLYALFGANAPLYSLTAYLLRVGCALALYGSIVQVWPRQRFAAAVSALLFAVYPGFVDQVNALDYQSHLASLFFILLSIWFSLQAVMEISQRKAVILILVSAVLTLLGLGLMEYYIGLEGLRFLAIGVLVWRRSADFRARMRALALAWLPFLVAPAAFLIWRVFFFTNQRIATNIGSMVAEYTGSPVLRGLWTVVFLIRDVANTLVVAWGMPLYQYAFNLRLRDFLVGAALALIAAALAMFLLRRRDSERDDEDVRSHALAEMAGLGFAGCVIALLPVAFGNRHIVFPEFARFTLTAAVGGVILLGSLIANLRLTAVRLGVPGVLVFLAVLANFGNAQVHADQTAEVRAFWQQVAWRAPAIRSGTTLVVNYPTTPVVEDYHIYAPANLIYYPEKTVDIAPKLALSALVLNREAVTSILDEKSSQIIGRRGSTLVRDFGNILVLSAPSTNACVHILDGDHVELSSREDYNVMLVARHSKIENVVPEARNAIPPIGIFGPEPAHTWCYFYEKADLARQSGNWAQVVRLGDEALQQNFHPADRVEWLPFLQGFAHAGRGEMLRALAPILLEEPLLGRQVCNELRAADGFYAGISQSTQQEMERLFCP